MVTDRGRKWSQAKARMVSAEQGVSRHAAILTAPEPMKVGASNAQEPLLCLT
jgi:hypothetical protein